MENISVLKIVLPSALLAIALVLTLVFLLKRRTFSHAQTRNCPHCFSELDSNQAICGNCHRKVVFI